MNIDSESPQLPIAVATLAKQCHVFRGYAQIDIEASKLFESMNRLKSIGYNTPIDITAVDLLEYGGDDRFRVVYQLLNLDSSARLEVRSYVNEPDLKLMSMFPLWRSADWLEREVYDMFGIEFEGHPNPKRLLMPDEFQSFPLRKDYLVKGRGERHNFPVITRAES